MKRDALPEPQTGIDEVAHFRREGYVMIPGVLAPAHVEACKTALSDLMQGVPGDSAYARLATAVGP